jgi:phosphoglycolate phosphatase-like HAD superfamily hydrolase
MKEQNQMSSATKLSRNRIAVIFDFDDTLAPSTYHTMLHYMGIDPDTFEEEKVQPMAANGWDTILARYYCLIRASQQAEQPITEAWMTEMGSEFDLFEGVPDMFGKVRNWAAEISDEIDVEFYLLTAGMTEIPRATPIAGEFTQLWGGACHFDENGEIVFVKRIISHPEKTRYLTQLAKGFHLEGTLQPDEVYRNIPPEDYYVPFDQMIYVGDGASDMPAFSMMGDEGGIAIAVVLADQIENWRGYDHIQEDRRVENLAAADYSDGSELMQSLHHAIDSIAQRIALRQLGQGK